MSHIPNDIELQIGLDGISQLKFHPTKNTLVVGTVDGRVRIYDCNEISPSEVYRKKWHRNLSAMDISKSGSSILTSSSQGSIKVHDFETGKETWCNLMAHDEGISSMIYQTENLMITGDDVGILKFWDSRQLDPVCELNLCDEDENEGNPLMSRDEKYLSSINDFTLDHNGRHLFVAMDDGTLVTVNTKRRKMELRSESLGYSARSVVTLKDQTKLGVVTEEGVVSIFNWNQFGNLSDRFPVVKKGMQIEKMIKITENVVALATYTGVIKSASLLPNYVLADIGVHKFPARNEQCGDCMSMAINHDHTFIASGCPESRFVCFYSCGIAVDEFEVEFQDRRENKRKKERTLIKERKKRRMATDDNGFFDGLCEQAVSEESEDVESIDESANEDDESD